MTFYTQKDVTYLSYVGSSTWYTKVCVELDKKTLIVVGFLLNRVLRDSHTY